MTEAYVRLLCPDCGKDWESTPGELPDPGRTFACPGCRSDRPLAEFMRTEHDLQTLKQFS
jgi:DNA-directed RNA polymerase subunit RPC12/RpoP